MKTLKKFTIPQKKIESFKVILSTIPPYDVSYKDKTLSDYELVVAIIDYINQIIPHVNEITDIVNELYRFIDNDLNDNISTSVANKLIEWRESGFLQEMVEDYLVNLTVAISDLLSEDEKNFESGWHTVLDTLLEMVDHEDYKEISLIGGSKIQKYTINKMSLSSLKNHDIRIEVFNYGEPFKIIDRVSGKYVEVDNHGNKEDFENGFETYFIRNTFANITFESENDIYGYFKSSHINLKVNLDEGFIDLYNKITNIIEVVIPNLEEWVTQTVNDLDERLTQDITDFKGEINQDLGNMNDGINQFKSETNQSILQFKNETNQNLGNMNDGINQFKSETNQSILQFKSETNQNILQFKNETNVELDKKQNIIKNERIINFMMPNGSPTAFMHRGWSAGYPENSFLSFQKAADIGATGIELDVHVTSDGHFVVIHDSTVDRTTNGTGAINNMTLAQIRALNITYSRIEERPVANWINDITFEESGDISKRTLQRIPTLEEVIDIAHGNNMRMLIEMKGSWNTTNIKKLSDLLVRRNMLNQCTIFSFDKTHIDGIRNQNKDILLGVITSNLSNADIDKAETLGNCLISFNYENTPIVYNNTLLKRARDLKIPMTAYTVNNRDIAFNLFSIGIGVTTDYYAKLRPSPYQIVANFKYNGSNDTLEQWYVYGSGDVLGIEKISNTSLYVYLPVSSFERWVCRPSMSDSGGNNYRVHASGETRNRAKLQFYKIGSTTPIPLSEIGTVWFSIVAHVKY